MMTDEPIVVKSDQAREVFERTRIGDNLSVRLLAYRCQEAQEQSLPGQDYARLSATPDGTSVSFCVCDGVGSAFKGDFAAWYLARRLVHWLRDLPAIPSAPNKVLSELQNTLTGWTEAGKMMLNSEGIDQNQPALLREVLLELRDTYGSETVFLGGRVDMTPSGPRAMLCWMGNVAARVWTTGTEPSIISGDDSQRWSTGRGVRGHVNVQVLAPRALRRIIVYTDGVERMAADLAQLNDADVQEQAQLTLLQPANDDMTVLDLAWGVPAEESHG
jgi:hypothetical protein